VHTVRRMSHWLMTAVGVSAAALALVCGVAVSGHEAISSAEVSQTNPPTTAVAPTITKLTGKMKPPTVYGSGDSPTRTTAA
jgi:hypothetical protein